MYGFYSVRLFFQLIHIDSTISHTHANVSTPAQKIAQPSKNTVSMCSPLVIRDWILSARERIQKDERETRDTRHDTNLLTRWATSTRATRRKLFPIPSNQIPFMRLIGFPLLLHRSQMNTTKRGLKHPPTYVTIRLAWRVRFTPTLITRTRQIQRRETSATEFSSTHANSVTLSQMFRAVAGTKSA